MNRARAFALVVVAAAIARAPDGAHADRVQEPPGPLPAFESQLANQLHVIVAPDPTAASIVVHVRYSGGVADERAPGSTHLVERLMFAGSVHVKDGDFEAKIVAAGGWASSEVTADHLSTFEEAPPEALELVLWLEAERMAGLADGITDAGLARERAAIAAERRAAYVDHPYGLVARTAQRLLWGTTANGHDPLADGIDHLTRAEVRDVVKARIVPRNAELVIAGRVDAAQAAALAKHYFEWIPSPPGTVTGTEPAPPAPLAKHVDATVVDPVPKVMVAFRTDAAFKPATIALGITARILAGGRASRLWRTLVDGGLATEVHADVVPQHRGGELRIIATAKPGVDPDRLAAGIAAAIADLRARDVTTAELQRAIATARAELVGGLENLAVRAATLADWSTELGSTQQLAAQSSMLGVTAADLRTTAAVWLADTASATVIGK